MADEVNLPLPLTPKTSWTIPFLLILSILSLAISGYLFWQNQRLQQKLAAVQTPSSIVIIPSPSPTLANDPTAEWKLYTNPVHNLLFKYPQDWQLNNQQDKEKLNAQLTLIKNSAEIKMYFKLDGIGGQGQTYEGKPFTLSGQNLYQFRKENTYNQTQMVGITETLTESLGVFRFDGKTYSITLSYPLAMQQTNEALELEKEFDQILSTFKFTQ